MRRIWIEKSIMTKYATTLAFWGIKTTANDGDSEYLVMQLSKDDKLDGSNIVSGGVTIGTVKTKDNDLIFSPNTNFYTCSSGRE
jgi:hypothetical protein